MSYYLLNAMEKDRMVTDECTLKYSSVFMVIFSMSYFSARLGSAEKKYRLITNFLTKLPKLNDGKSEFKLFSLLINVIKKC